MKMCRNPLKSGQYLKIEILNTYKEFNEVAIPLNRVSI